MNPLVESIKEWLMQQPVQPSVMAPIPSRARLAADTKADREARAEILRVAGMLPLPGAQALGVAGDLAAESELTPLGVAKAVGTNIIPIRSGPGRLNVMGEASKINPEVLDRIKKAIAGGTPAKAAYQAENALPLIKRIDKPVEDAWVPLVPQATKLRPEVAKDISELRLAASDDAIKKPFADVVQPQYLEKVAEHYPHLLKTPVTIKTLGVPGRGEHDPSTGKVLVDAFSNYGPRGVIPILGHEMTHALQTTYNLAPGYSKESVVTDRSNLIKRVELAADQGTAADRKALDYYFNWGKQIIEPGNQVPPEIQGASPEMQRLIKTLAWSDRAARTASDIDYRLYKAYHGEQAAEGARQWLAGQTPDFTTPLSKQVLYRKALSEPYYGTRLQALYELKKSGVFDPLANPYELPQAFVTP